MSSMDDIMDHCLRVVEREATQAGVRIVRSRPDGDLPLVLMDTDQMTQVFLNILINAIEATPRGGKVVVGCETDVQGHVMIHVADTGEGIPRENLDKLFDPFFSTKKKGTGLGLAIVKSILEGHDGEIEVESEPGKGTRFTVTLRIYQPPGEDAADQQPLAGAAVATSA